MLSQPLTSRVPINAVEVPGIKFSALIQETEDFGGLRLSSLLWQQLVPSESGILHRLREAMFLSLCFIKYVLPLTVPPGSYYSADILQFRFFGPDGAGLSQLSVVSRTAKHILCKLLTTVCFISS